MWGKCLSAAIIKRLMGISLISKRLFEADVLRAFAILVILISHAHYYFDHQTIVFQMMDRADEYIDILGLGLFFFISGYLLYHNNPTITNLRDIFGFYKKRVLRIYPLYWAALFVSLLCFGYLHMYYFHPTDFSIYTFITNLLGLQFITNETLLTFWFIGAILVYYTLYPIIIRVSKNTRDIALISLCITAIIICAKIVFRNIDQTIYLYLMVFAAGIIARRAEVFELGKIKYYVPVLIACLLPVLVVEAFLKSEYFLYALLELAKTNILAILLCLLLFWTVRKYGSLSRSDRLLLPQISYGSYATYLFDPICFGTIYTITQFFDIGGNLLSCILIAVGVPTAIIIGYTVQKMENNFRRFLNGRIPSNPQQIGGV